MNSYSDTPEEHRKLLQNEGKRFRLFREKSHLSQSEAAEHLDLSTRSLGSYERGEKEISLSLAIKMAKLYNTTFEELTDYKNFQFDK